MSSRPSRRTVSAAAAVAACTLLTVPPARAAESGPAPSPSPGKARAVTAELALDVSLLNKAVNVPVNIALNKVETPAQSDTSMLTAKVDGVAQQGPVTLVKADVGKSVTRSDAKGTAASVQLVNADVHAPGLPATALLGLEAMSAEATCPVDGRPTANVVAPAGLTVLGKPVTVGLYGPTKVDVPMIGSVSVEFSKRTTTSTTAAASALEVKVEVNPLNLNVAKVTGTITVASVSCEKPSAPSGTPTAATSAPTVQPVVDTTTRAAAPQAATGKPAAGLAATGGSSATGPLAAGAAALVAGGAGALWATRRRRAAHARRH
ncbi:LPXTG cell wall anchor domain-containing protein [Streptomyces kaniharaensis]|uniref:LPXTG cell wall anchor domain-containing protein n=1 Tax=Streptomyces kaniharaensis TaxID=212423 RepID=A0A6N7KUQ9_9ACTN|nr:SCO1860 family LAETG-anchored protein [Streptomyces kaniharaensis]MQS14565.1 LPXTG cell wall anchor domain-containing protein [Streptomyces kaniharaensis]